MESVISLVIFGVVYAAIYVIKAAFAGNDDVEAKPIVEDSFPEVEELRPEYDEPQGQVVFVEPEPKPKKRMPKRTVPGKKEAVRTTDGGPVLQETEKLTKKERIAIKGSSEAKRAFIYSEIFNRKY